MGRRAAAQGPSPGLVAGGRAHAPADAWGTLAGTRRASRRGLPVCSEPGLGAERAPAGASEKCASRVDSGHGAGPRSPSSPRRDDGAGPFGGAFRAAQRGAHCPAGHAARVL